MTNQVAVSVPVGDGFVVLQKGGEVSHHHGRNKKNTTVKIFAGGM